MQFLIEVLYHFPVLNNRINNRFFEYEIYDNKYMVYSETGKTLFMTGN